LQPNTGALVGVRDLRGYDLPVSEDTHRLMAVLSPRPRGPWYPVDLLPPRPLLAFAGVRVVLTPEAQPELGLPLLDLGAAPLYAYGLEGAAPRAWFTAAAVQVSDPAAGLEWVSRESSAAARPPVEGLSRSLDGEAQVVPLDWEEVGQSLVRLTGLPPEGGLAVLADAWAPGWRASVDGVPVSCLRVGGAFRGVEVPSGAKEVVFRYRPDGWIWGLRCALLGLLLVVGILVSCARRRSAAPL
jgi:hypothetical protein